ncbi:hypothetical protein WG66_000063 [Moniliophthora roreri]|nr:hypothetical protein WG66_000063 [Moniliophthora roreri]
MFRITLHGTLGCEDIECAHQHFPKTPQSHPFRVSEIVSSTALLSTLILSECMNAKCQMVPAMTNIPARAIHLACRKRTVLRQTQQNLFGQALRTFYIRSS